MGEVIRKNAAVEDILKDVGTTLTRAVTREGAWRTLAEEKLGGVVTLSNSAGTALTAAETAYAPLAARIRVEDEKADGAIGKVRDDIYNALGRAAGDPALSLLFPGGIGYYADGMDEGEPDRMELLAELLTAGIHQRLDRAVASSGAQAVRQAAAPLRAAHDAARLPRARVKLLGLVRTALGRHGQSQLAALKRAYQSAGFTEADIHTVIPDRPTPTPAPKMGPLPPPAT